MKSLGKYEIVKLIGKGSVGEVYKAFDPIIDRFVAIKVLFPEMIENKEYFSRFKKEIRAQGKLIHPNIAVIFDVGFIDGKYAIIMEYIDGISLRQYMRRHKIVTLRNFFAITSQICDGLQFAHSQGVIHRDIKPENIFISVDGVVKIIDFSIAKLHSSNVTATDMNMLLGTAPYMSPEQINGGDITPAVDQFSLGIVCYEMITGTRPFDGITVAETAINIVSKKASSIVHFNPMVDEELNGIIQKLLAKKPEDRYEDLVEFRKVLKEYFRKLSPEIVEDIRVEI